MADDSQVALRIINEHLQLIGQPHFFENQDLHINTTTSGPSHFVEQGTIDYAFLGEVGHVDFTYTMNANHVTDVTDSTVTEANGDVLKTHSTFTSNGNGYNIVSHSWVNGVDQGVVHTTG